MAGTPAPDRRSRFRRRTVHLTRRGRVLVAVGVIVVLLAYALGWREALVAGCFALALVVIGAVFVLMTRPRLEVVRVFSPPIVSAGDPVRVSLAVRNAGARPTLPGWWNDGLPWWEDVAPERMPGFAPAAPSVRPDGRDRSRVFSYDLHTQHRGVFRVGPLAVEHGDAFGAAASVTAQGGQDELVVVPVVWQLPAGALSTAEAEGDALIVRRRVTGNDDDLTTREYRPGDALRRVHWRASARHGELMVRQEEQRSFPQVRLLLDTRRDGYGDAEAVTAAASSAGSSIESDVFENAIELYASLAMHLLDRGFDVRVEETAPPQIAAFADRWEGGRREERFLASLAPLHLIDVPRWETPEPAVDRTGPLFAVLGTPSEVTVAWVRRQRRPGELAVAFLGEAGSPVAQELADVGWIVVENGEDADPVELWAAAHEAWGVSRGPR
jgi:uncharacterized protein (DUF58 family)